MAGKLNFATSHLWGRATRVYLVPLYKHAAKRGVALRHPLRVAIPWWVEFLRAPLTRPYWLPPPEIGAVVFVDASMSGLGVVFSRPGTD